MAQGRGTERAGEPAYLVRSVAKAMSILELFDRDRYILTGSEISALVGMNRATCYRFCQTLVSLGYLEQLDGGSFRVGMRVLRLAPAASTGRDLLDIARAPMLRLHERLGESISMAVQDGVEILLVMRLKSDQLVNIQLSVGSRLPIYASSLGKAILAALPKDERVQIISQLKFKKLTPNTIDSRAALERQLDVTARRGFATNNEEVAVGSRGVAAAVLHTTGRPLAAVNIGLTRPVTDDELDGPLAVAVTELADEISARASYLDLATPVAGGPLARTR